MIEKIIELLENAEPGEIKRVPGEYRYFSFRYKGFNVSLKHYSQRNFIYELDISKEPQTEEILKRFVYEENRDGDKRLKELYLKVSKKVEREEIQRKEAEEKRMKELEEMQERKEEEKKLEEERQRKRDLMELERIFR